METHQKFEMQCQGQTEKRPVISLVYNTAVYVYKFRMNLIAELKSLGYRVVVISPVDNYVPLLELHGIEHYPVTMSAYGMNPFGEIRSALQILATLRKLRPAVSLHYTIKCNIFGSLAAWVAGVPVINNIAGAGKALSNESGLLWRVISWLYKLALQKSRKVFFQNRDDMVLFLRKRLVPTGVEELLPGSGVDLRKYSPIGTRAPGSFRFLFVGRLLVEKGIGEYLEAAVELVKEHPSWDVVFEIVGEYEDEKGYIDKRRLDAFLTHSFVHYHGAVSPDHMPQIIGRADCVVLPSYYREGVPRSLLEAAAMACPIITTDSVGCREVVDEGQNGFKCGARDVPGLKATLARMFQLPVEIRQEMGAKGRRKMQSSFDERLVLDAYLRAISCISHGKPMVMRT